MNTQNELSKETTYVTPNELVYGWLLLIAGSLPVLMGFSDKNKILLYVGLAVVLIGMVLIVIGNIKNKKLLKQDANSKTA